MKNSDIKNLHEAYLNVKNKKTLREEFDIAGVTFGDQFLNEVIPYWTNILVTAITIAFGFKYKEKIKSLINNFIENQLTSKIKNSPEIKSLSERYNNAQDSDEKREIFLQINDIMSEEFFGIFKLSPNQKSKVWGEIKKLQ